MAQNYNIYNIKDALEAAREVEEFLLDFVSEDTSDYTLALTQQFASKLVELLLKIIQETEDDC